MINLGATKTKTKSSNTYRSEVLEKKVGLPIYQLTPELPDLLKFLVRV